MNDIAYREELGYTHDEAVAKARAYSEEHDEPTFVYYLRFDPDLDPADRYDWCPESEWDYLGYNNPRDRIVWSSIEGEY